MADIKTSTNKKSERSNSALVPTFIVLAVILVALVGFASFWTELKWFEQVNALQVFWTQCGAFALLAGVGVVLTTLVVFINFRIAVGKKIPPVKIYTTDEKKTSRDEYLRTVQTKGWLFYGLVPLGAGMLFGSRLGADWRTVLLWLNSSTFGTKDPEYQLDVSFYVFTLPVLHIVLSFIASLLVLSVIFAILGYWLSGEMDSVKGKLKFSRKAQIHAAVLAIVATLSFAANQWVSRYDLLLGNNSKFSGANFTDINASKPGLTVLTIVIVLVAVLFLLVIIKRTWKPAVVGMVATLVTALVLVGLYPFLMQNFKVNPNAAELESEYIQRNIDATLTAYGLDEVETKAYAARTEAKSGQLRQDSETAAQIRLLDPSIVAPSFNQLQQNRQYYHFVDPLSVDRYEIDGKMRDTVIAMRELNLNGLDNSRRSWVNDHTVYTHGFGVAAAYGNTVTAKGDPAFWEAGIPSVGEMGDYESRVYFGQQSAAYSIVGAPKGTDPWELDYPDDNAPNGQVNNTYQGDGGPKISNAFAKLMFAIKFRSTELFFSDRVNSSSQILYTRNPHERIAKVAPYLTLDSKALPAVVDMDGDPNTPKELVWIVDGYTTSNNYPYSDRESLEQITLDSRNMNMRSEQQSQQINYIRNSVKAVVNAYDGKVTLYQWDQKDPILNAWKGIFPKQITELKEMPGDLIAHVRYPEDLFKVQRSLLARYHVTDAKSFYSGGDFWQVPREPTMEATAVTPAQPPYYLTLQMPGQKTASFSISTSYIPGGNTNRNVMTGFLAADSNAGNTKGKIADSYGKLRLLETPRDLTVPGPGQAENTMITNPAVSTALNLLRKGGTTINEGNLLSLPIGGGLLYVQPIYVQATSGTQYPTLQYVLALFGDQVGFAPTLDEALDQVFGGDSGVQVGDAAIAGEKEAPLADPEVAGAQTKPKGTKPAEKPASKPATKASAAGAQKRLDNALNSAREAIAESETARKAQDWQAYGVAQGKLAKAIQEALDAQKELQQTK